MACLGALRAVLLGLRPDPKCKGTLSVRHFLFADSCALNAGPACRHMPAKHGPRASPCNERNRLHRVCTKDRTGLVATGPFTSRTVPPRTFLPPGPFFHRTVPSRTFCVQNHSSTGQLLPGHFYLQDHSSKGLFTPELFIPWTF